MEENPLRKLESFGQSVWTDFIRRAMLTSGALQQWINEDGVSGVTSNPSIFEKAIAGSQDYDEQIQALAQEGRSAADIYQAVTVKDIQDAADLLRPTYDRLEGKDGFVSLEVSPHLAYNTEGTVAEARRLWAAVNRPNVMIKVPGTRQGLPAIEQLTSEGINVNITLLFGLPRYRRVIDSYLTGLERRLAAGQPIQQIASVASFFLSRIDVLVDPMLEKVIERGTEGGAEAEAPPAYLAIDMVGQTAIASAKVAYQIYENSVESERFRQLAEQGARAQRLLWASTSTKNPAYSDVKYPEALIGPATIDTMAEETLNAYRDHGRPEPHLKEGAEEAQEILSSLERMDIQLDQVTQQLEKDGVDRFVRSYNQLMDTIEEKRAAALSKRVDQQVLALGGYTGPVQERVAELTAEHVPARIWRRDASVWKKDPAQQQEIRNSLGWLYVADKMEENLAELIAFRKEVRDAGFRHVVHIGMGGSSLAPLVLERSFDPGEEGLPLTVLDTTDPATILHVESAIPLAHTLFIVASKSGTTAEVSALGDYFYQRVRDLVGDRAGESFCAITDPGSPLVKLAQERKFRRVFLNMADIGGRYSALSYFGMVPAALMDLPVEELVDRALRMVHACSSSVPVEQNPGLLLGAAMGELARSKRDKVTFFCSSPIETLGTWLEQLLAESTGKEETGLLPVAGEPAGDPVVYRDDRLFVYLRLEGADNEILEQGVGRLREAGQPLVTLQLDDTLELSREFFRWEFATAVAGQVLDIDPFDQPNVQESKENTNRLLALVREQGHLPVEAPAIHEGRLSYYGKEGASSSAALLGRFLAQARPGDYVALLAYLPELPTVQRALQEIRLGLRDRLHLATTLGYGPRYLHSTGQYHKGGPNTGLFLLLTADDTQDVTIPGRSYTFGTLKRAQALGDLEALRRHGRRVVRVDLGADLGQGLAELRRALEAGLQQMGEQLVDVRPETMARRNAG